MAAAKERDKKGSSHHTEHLKLSVQFACGHTACALQPRSFLGVPVVPTRSPDVQMSIQHVTKLRGALSEVCLCHGAQIPATQLLKHCADLWQSVKVLGPE